MSSSRKYSLENLSNDADMMGKKTVVVEKEVDVEVEPAHGYGFGVWGWLIVVAIITGIILALFGAPFVLSTNPQTGEVYLDWAKLIIWSIVIAIIVVFILYLIFGATGYGYYNNRC